MRGGFAIKTPSFEVEEGGCRQRPPSILGFGGSCSSIVVLTTSLIKKAKTCARESCRPVTLVPHYCYARTEPVFSLLKLLFSDVLVFVVVVAA